MHKEKIFHAVKGDISGALISALITLPLAMGYGILAFSALGIEFAPMAAVTGVYAAVFAGFFASLFGGSPILITAPPATLTLVISIFVTGLVSNPAIQTSPATVIGLASLCVFTAGCFQILFGLLGLSNLVKYVPKSVVSGFINGIALLIIFRQTREILGLEVTTPFFDIFRHPTIINPITATVGIITIVSSYISMKFSKSIPATLTALIAGMGSYYLLISFFPGSQPGQMVGLIQNHFPVPDVFLSLYDKFNLLPMKSILPQLLITSLVLSLIGSLASMLCAAASDNLTESRHNSKKVLFGQGIGNMVGSLFGSIASTGSIVQSTANYNSGGRTQFSGMLSSVFILFLFLITGSHTEKIPVSVLAGIIFVVGAGMFDKWTLEILKRLFISFTCPKESRIDILIIVFVAVITVSINLIVAVGVGMLLASILFISKISRSVIQRHYFADHFHSRKMRPTENIKLLEKEGRKISILQLQGPIFFGSAEHLADKVLHTSVNSDYIILDFKRISEIDSTGSAILLRVAHSIEKENKHLLFSNLQNNKTVWSFLKIMKFADSLTGDKLYPDTDSALEWAEEQLLNKNQPTQKSVSEIDLQTVSLFNNFTPNEFNAVQAILTHQAYNEKVNVFRENDSSRDLYILIKGLMTVSIYLPERERYKRLFTYSPGVVFGEMSFLDDSPRSAGVQAQEDSEVYCLQYSDFEILCRQQPEIANKLLKNIALEISHRLRRTSDQVRELEEN